MNRRHFLLTLITVVLASCSRTGDDTRVLPGWLAKLTLDPVAAAALGEAYLKEHPAERDPKILLNLIETATAYGDTFDALDRTVRAEYAQADFVQVNGWILSHTEVRIYALIAVSGGLGAEVVANT